MLTWECNIVESGYACGRNLSCCLRRIQWTIPQPLRASPFCTKGPFSCALRGLKYRCGGGPHPSRRLRGTRRATFPKGEGMSSAAVRRIEMPLLGAAARRIQIRLRAGAICAFGARYTLRVRYAASPLDMRLRRERFLVAASRRITFFPAPRSRAGRCRFRGRPSPA